MPRSSWPRRLAAVSAVGLIATTSAVAGTPLIRTLATGHGVGHVTLGVSTESLRSRLWLQRIGGSGTARGTGYTSCQEMTSGVGSAGQDEMFAFSLAPNARQILWRSGGGPSCIVTVTLRGKGRLAVALRGY